MKTWNGDENKSEVVIYGLLETITHVNKIVTMAVISTNTKLPNTSKALKLCQELMDDLLARHPMIAEIMPDA